ncbi:MAG: hypothetical protein VX012_08760, partial [Planctomycetota bacterium]|nr:hypothetical protein [Planctomycetota bacterium]
EVDEQTPPSLSLYGPGVRLAGLAATISGGVLNLMDIDGLISLAAGAAAENPGGVLSLRNEAGLEVVRVGVTPDDDGVAEIHDAQRDRKRRITAP